MKNNIIIYVARASNSKRDCDAWSLLLLAATVRSFAHIPLGISDPNKMMLWPECGGRAEFSLHTKNMRSVWFVVKRRGCCYNLSGGVALIVWFTTNGMCVKNNTIIYVARASNNKRDCGAWSLLLLAATVWSFRQFPIATLKSVFWDLDRLSSISGSKVIIQKKQSNHLIMRVITLFILDHNLWTSNPSKSSKIWKDLDLSLVSNKNLSEMLPSSSLGLGPDEVGQNGLKQLHLQHHS